MHNIVHCTFLTFIVVNVIVVEKELWLCVYGGERFKKEGTCVGARERERERARKRAIEREREIKERKGGLIYTG